MDPYSGARVEARLTVTVRADRGRVSLASASAALSFLKGEGFADREVIVDGPMAALNEALSVVTYECRAADGCGLGADAVRVSVDDGGFSGAGGALRASGELAVTVVGY